MRESSAGVIDFYARLTRNPVALCFALGFLATKVWSNVAPGGRLAIGIRSGVMGLVTTAIGLGLIHLLSQGAKKQSDMPRLAPSRARQGLLFLLLWWLFWVVSIVDRLQRQGDLGGAPLLSGFPPITWFDALLERIGGWHVWSAVPGLKGFMVENILRGQVILVLVPVIIFILMRYRRRDLMPAHGDIRPALPFLVLYVAAFLFSGLSVARVTFLIYAFLYPGVTEEFFYRGGVQPLLFRSSASPALAIALAALVFAGGHIPDFVSRVYPGMLPLAMGQVASVALYGTLLGYGVHRSGMLWPWMVVHAFSNVVG